MKSFSKKLYLILALIICAVLLCSCSLDFLQNWGKGGNSTSSGNGDGSDNNGEFIQNPLEPLSTFLNIAVVMTFSDSSFTSDELANIDSNFNGGGNSLKQYYSDISYGSLDLETVYVFVTSNKTVAYFKALGLSGSSNQVTFVQQLLNNKTYTVYKDVNKTEAYDPTTDGKLDNFKAGYIDCVTLLIPATVQNTTADGNSALWPHTVFYSKNIGKFEKLNYDRFIVFPYNMQILGSKATPTKNLTCPVGIICHEMMHNLGNDIGINDLYHYDDKTDPNFANLNPVGIYDIMAYTDYETPQQVNMYYKYLLGFATLTEYNSDEPASIKLTDPTGIKFGDNGKGEFFIAEYYSACTISGYSVSAGILIFRVNSNVNTGNSSKLNGQVNDQIFIFRTKTDSNYNQPNFPAIFASGSTFDGLTYSDGTSANLKVSMSFDNKNFQITVGQKT